MSSSKCITDCSILNQTTCRLVSRKPLMVDKEKISSQLWSKDGCYNATLFQATEDYNMYEKVSIDSISGKEQFKANNNTFVSWLLS